MKSLLALVLFVPLLPAAVAGAAQATGALEVRLTDPYDGPVAGADVVAVSLSGYRQLQVTDSAGRALFPALVPGLYGLDATASFGRVLGDVVVLSGQSVHAELRIVASFSPGLVVRPVDAQGLALPGARVLLRSPGGETLQAFTDSAGVAEFQPLRPGRWRVAASLPGFEGPPLEADVAYAPPATVEVPLVLAGFGETLVVTATRNPVRLVDAPVTTSVLGADRIATAPASDVADMLRALPGVNVVRLSARDIALTNRGATTPAANSQLVLVDGRSVYLDFFGTVLWDSLSFNQADVRQIEVVRGPASATWGANAMTGAVNIVTRDPRDSEGTDLSFWAGAHDRDAGFTAGMRPGSLYGVNATVTRAPTPDIAYRVSAGQSRTEGYPRPTGRIPSISDPRIAGRRVGGAAFPALPNPRATQLKFDARLDQRVHGGRGRFSYSAGVARPQGVTHTALGPFELSRGHVAYAKVNYDRDALSLQVFANFTDGVAPSQLLPDTELAFGSRSVDAEVVHRSTAGRHRFTYGGNVRRAAFDVDLAALAPDRVEFAGFFQDELDTDRFRFVAAGRVDKFGNISQPFVSPRLALGVKLGPDHMVTGSYNRAFRAPSAVEAFLDHSFGVPIDLSPLEAFRPFLPLLVPPTVPEPARPAALAELGAALDDTVAEPFRLETRAIGGSIPYYSGSPRSRLLQESVDSYEVSYAGTIGSARTAVGAAVYRSDFSDLIALLDVPLDRDPFTADHPPAGWRLPPALLDLMAAFGGGLPRTSLSYENIGGLSQYGVETWAEQPLGAGASLWGNYSRQLTPRLAAASGEASLARLNLPPAHRLNAGASYNGPRLLGDLSVHHATRAFWSDVLTVDFHGYSPAYTLVNLSAGVKWRDQRYTALVRVSNLFNRTVQQHLFGDLLRRSVVGELRVSFR